MALTRHDPITTIGYDSASFPYNDTVLVADFAADLPVSPILPGDELFCQVAYRFRYNSAGGGTVLVDPPWGGGEDAANLPSAPQDVTIGSGVTTRSGLILYRRVADGTSADDCEVSVTSAGYASGTSEASTSCIMWAYRGGELAYHSRGSLAGGDDSGLTPTDASTTAVPDDSIVISGAYQRLNTVPSLDTANGFGVIYDDDPDPVDVDPAAIAVADRQVLVGATIDLPQWLVQRGLDAHEHHNYWAVYTYTLTSPLQQNAIIF